MALTDLDIVKQWANPSMDSARDDELDRCCDAASDWVKRVANWEIEQASYTLYLNGVDAIGSGCNVLLVPAKYRPVIHSGATLVTVTEDGSALSVAASYDTTKDVMLLGANFDTRLELAKPSSPWSRGYANVAVSFDAGYASGSVPEDVVQLATEVALLMFRSPNFAGKSSKTGRGGSVSFEKALTPWSLATLERLTQGASAI